MKLSVSILMLLNKYFAGTISRIRRNRYAVKLPRRFLFLTEKHLLKSSSLKYLPKVSTPTGNMVNIMPGILRLYRLLQWSTRTGDYRKFKEYSSLVDKDTQHDRALSGDCSR
ncbi:MAG: hypothetical protein MZV63_37170 [Marinilabiliales bacterium]|nr:hypothetical protein [Marinilabiliales bacterium]